MKFSCSLLVSIFVLILAAPALTQTTAPVEEQSAPPVSGEASPGSARPIRGGGPSPLGILLRKTQPSYPDDAKRAGVSGAVLLQATVGTDGIVKDVSVISGPQMLEQAALDAVKTWRYRPYLLNGQPTEARTTVSVEFYLPSTEVSATSTDPQVACNSCSIAIEVLSAVANLKPGMTREQIEKEFQPDDTFGSGPIKRYVYKKCAYIKIDIDFDLVDANAVKDNPEDRVVKISKPYIEQQFVD